MAVASTQSFNVQQYTNLNGSASAKTTDHWSNGWQIRDLGPSVTEYDAWAGNYPGLGPAGSDDDGDGDQLETYEDYSDESFDRAGFASSDDNF